ncbi:hypothetical protein [Piscibacillus salipiscarius]|uniref:hypothetical protein n=1 Tax=Piscibacillus salipiscarius TaxID=299480 RepID=UPI00367335E7
MDRILDYNFTSEKQSETNQDKESYTWTDDVLPRTPTNQTTQPDEDDIINKYETSYEELKQETITEVEQIKENVLSELEEDPNPLKLGAMAIKYEQKATELENDIDQKFEELFEAFEQELDRYGYSKASVVKLERKYKSTKTDLKNELVKEASAWMEGRKF